MYKSARIVFAITLLLPNISHAAEKLFLAGVEVTTASSAYLYMGTSIPLPESTLAEGYVLHLWADYQTYSYDAAAMEIDVIVDSLSAAIAYHDSGYNYWWNMRLGVVRSDTNLSPSDLGNASAGFESNLKIQLEGEKRLSTNFKIVGNTEYIFEREAYWLRARFLMRRDDNSYHGPELVYQGDPVYSAGQLGWIFAENLFNNDWSWTAKAGFRLDKNETSAYAGVELAVPY